MRSLFTKKRSLVALAAVAALAIAGGAFAFFTDSGSGTGSGSVGTSAPWGVAVNSSGATFSPNTLSAIYPGVGTEVIPYTVTNNGKGHQNLASITLAVATDSTGTSTTNPNFGDAQSYSGGTLTDIPGCLASWFTVAEDSGNPAGPGASTSPAAVDLAPAGAYSGSIDLTMSNAPTSQNSCKSSSPAVTVAAN